MPNWRNTLDILLIALLVSSCVVSPDAPKMPRKPKLYTYIAPDRWGRVDENDQIVEAGPLIHYNLIHIDDTNMVFDYITDLHHSCEKWSKDDSN